MTLMDHTGLATVTVQQGDTLWGLVTQYNIDNNTTHDYQDIGDLNPQLASDQLIYEGDEIFIPDGDGNSSSDNSNDGSTVGGSNNQSENESDDNLDPNDHEFANSSNITVGSPGPTINQGDYRAYTQYSAGANHEQRVLFQAIGDDYNRKMAVPDYYDDPDLNSRRARSGLFDGQEKWLAEFIQVDLSAAYGLPKGYGYCWVRYTNIHDPHAPTIYAEYLVTVNFDNDSGNIFQNRDLSEIEATLDELRSIGPRGFSTSPGFSAAVSFGSATALFDLGTIGPEISKSWTRYFNQYTLMGKIKGPLYAEGGYFESLADTDGNILWKGIFLGAGLSWDPLAKYIPTSPVNFSLTRPFYEERGYEESDGFRSLLW